MPLSRERGPASGEPPHFVSQKRVLGSSALTSTPVGPRKRSASLRTPVARRSRSQRMCRRKTTLSPCSARLPSSSVRSTSSTTTSAFLPRVLGMLFEDHSLEDFQRLIGVNLGGVFLGSKHAVIRFKEQGGGGVILNTGSVAGLVGWGGSVYGSTKGGVHQLTKALAVEAAPFGIRVNAICPAGMPYTGFMAAGGLNVAQEAMQQVGEQVGSSHPLGRPITAEDCAEAAVFLCSDEATNITGVLLPVDGGYVAR